MVYCPHTNVESKTRTGLGGPRAGVEPASLLFAGLIRISHGRISARVFVHVPACAPIKPFPAVNPLTRAPSLRSYHAMPYGTPVGSVSP